MAIFLPKSDALYLHIPKTGGHFVEFALKELGIESEEAEPVKGAPKGHGIACQYPSAGFTFATVVHPRRWYESYWKFRCNADLNFEEGVWYPHRVLGGKVVDDFDTWMRGVFETEPSYVTRMYEWFVGPPGWDIVDRVCRRETLNEDLANLLTYLGYKVTLDDLNQIERQNVGPNRPLQWPCDLEKQMLRAERPAIERFYSGTTLQCRCCSAEPSKLGYFCDLDGSPAEYKWFRCAECGSLTTNYDYADISKVYDESYITHNLKALANNREALKGQVSENIRMLTGIGGRTMLDIGCLEGVMMEAMTEQGYECWGFDVIPEAQQYVSRTLSIPEDRIKIANKFSAGLFDQIFNVIICREVVEHVEDPGELLQQIRQALAPGGVAQIQTPRYSETVRLWDQKAHLLCFHKEALERAIRLAGMEPVPERCLFWEGGQCWTCTAM